MQVISNASPIILLEKVGELYLLASLYKNIVIPEAVYQEVFKSYKADFEKPDWIKVKKVSDSGKAALLAGNLGSGESEAIVLYLEQNADLLLLDDFSARSKANSMGIKITGIAGILLDAKVKGLIDNVKKILDNLIISDYRISDSLYEDVLVTANEN